MGFVLENDFSPRPAYQIIYMTTNFQQNYFFLFFIVLWLGFDYFSADRRG